MFIFTKQSVYFVFIDIPIPLVTYIRSQIIKDLFQVIKHYWFIKDEMLDLAHIPYKMKKEFVRSDFEHTYITFSRNPYDRFLSIYQSTTQSDEMSVEEFIKTELVNEKFEDYKYTMIHHYPQYKFIIDENDEVCEDIKIFKLETYNNEFIKFNEKAELPNYNLCDYFTNETLAIFNKIYKKDFEVFDYDMVTDLSSYTAPTSDVTIIPVSFVPNILSQNDEPVITAVPTTTPVSTPSEVNENKRTETIIESKINPLKQFLNRK